MKNIMITLGFLALLSTCTINAAKYTQRQSGSTGRIRQSSESTILGTLEHELAEILDI